MKFSDYQGSSLPGHGLTDRSCWFFGVKKNNRAQEGYPGIPGSFLFYFTLVSFYDKLLYLSILRGGSSFPHAQYDNYWNRQLHSNLKYRQ
jgi:hypothetical protein